MLAELFAPIALTCIILLAPGYLLLRALGMPRPWAVCIAPIVSMALIAGLGQAYAFLGITSGIATILGPVVGLPLVAFALTRRNPRALAMPAMPAWMPIPYLVLGAALGYSLYLSRLGEANAIYQVYDVTQHLNVVQAMADSGKFTSLNVNYYLSDADSVINPLFSNSFYPAGWHALCALVMMGTGASAPAAINASMFVFPCLVYPLAMSAFLSAAFEGERGTVLLGAFTVLAFVIFPWGLIVFGPVYPNVAGFCCVPATMALFMRLFSADAGRSERVRFGTLLFLAVIGQALLHPNTLFTCVVILAPWCITRIWQCCEAKGFNRARSIIICAGFALVCVLIWFGCYVSPLFASTVTAIWPPYSRPWQQLVNILTQTYTLGFWYEMSAQVLLGALVITGTIRALYTPGRRWLVFSYAVAAFICLYCATQEGSLKQILGGFWYTDPMRLASLCCVAAVPLATLGLAWVYELVTNLVTSYNQRRHRQTHRYLVAAAVACAFLLVNFMPELNWPGAHDGLSAEENVAEAWYQVRDRSKNTHTTFGDYRTVIKDAYDSDSPLDSSEKSFLRTVKRLTGSELVINDPMDGSFLGYGYNGTRMYYRNFLGVGGSSESAESALIRTSLCDIATNDDVREAVDAIGARYVIVLHQEDSAGSMINLRGDYDPTLFSGISSITTSTPGFKLVYRAGTLCLYEIEE